MQVGGSMIMKIFGGCMNEVSCGVDISAFYCRVVVD